MLVFWVLAAAMVLSAALIVLVPLWRPRPSAELSRDKLNTTIFRERLADLEREHREGRLDPAHYQQLREELERTLLVDVPHHDSAPSRSGRVSLILSVTAAVILPLLALSYYYASSYRGEAATWISLQTRLQDAVERALQWPDKPPPEAEEDLPGFTRALQARLLADGMKDPNGLFLLGVNYIRLQAPQAALAALRRAYELAPDNPQIMLAYAQAMMMTEDGRLSKDSAHLLSQVLQAYPDHQGALMLFAFGAFNSGLYEDAIKAWQQLLALRDPASEGTRLLRNSIDRAKELLAQRDQAPTATQPTAPGVAQITVTVELSPELQQRLAPEDTLFIFAKAASGPPMPLAAVRQPAQGFPVQVVLNDSQAMLPSMKLSHFDQVIVGARISKAGAVTAKPGDLQGISGTLSLAKGPQTVSVLIDQVVQ